MPVIPTAQSSGIGNQRSVAAGQLPSARQSIQTSSADFGGISAQQNANIAQTLMGMGEKIEKVRKQRASIEVADLEMQAQKDLLSFMHDGETGLLNQRGEAAMGSNERFEKKMAEIRQNYSSMTDNPYAQQLLGQSFDRLELSGYETTLRHEEREVRAYGSTIMGAKAATAIESIALNPNDEDNFNTSMQSLIQNTEAQMAMDGLKRGDEAWNLGIKKATSSALMQRYSAMLDNATPDTIVKVGKMYENDVKAGRMTLQASQKMDAKLSAILPQAEAMGAFARDRESLAIESINIDQIFKGGQILQESGGQQFGGAGSVAGPDEPTTSPAGALGIAQIMPETGPEAAKFAGLEWDENRFKNDAEYNAALGLAYVNKMRERFGSNELALMAYNAGPTIMDDVMNGTNNSGKNKDGLKLGDPRKGEISISEFRSRFPYKETREYVSNIIRKQRFDTKQIISPEKAQEMASKMQPESAKYYLSEVEKQNARFATAVTAQKNQTLSQLQMVLEQAKGDLNAVPAQLRADAIEYGVWDKASQFRGYSDPAFDWKNMNTDEKLSVDFSDPETRVRLSYSDFDKFSKEQEKMATDPKEKALSTRIDEALAYAYGTNYDKSVSIGSRGGVMVGNEPAKGATKERIRRIREQLDLEVRNTFESTGKVPSRNEVMDIADNLLVNRAFDPKGFFNKITDDIFDMSIADIPDDIRGLIEQSLRSEGIALTEAQVMRNYRLYLESTLRGDI